ncbi:hypothetical protein ACH47B_13245 [Rhodococcus sp. NPDC019627]|uniref:hypothetical protein n=1 Tax=unclassified Rhodococcus (in: high G+C Gram-positive bacteria) TaxID=192944 RepID=UPI0033CDAF31
MHPQTFRKRPVEIQAVRWTGENLTEVHEFTGEGKFAILAEIDRMVCGNPDCTAELFVAANRVWMAIETGEWIIQDAKGFYPCKPDIFAATYEAV